jgi:hypothetical protein
MKVKLIQQSDGSYKAYVGKWVVGTAHYSSCTSRDDPNKYRISCLLPGLLLKRTAFPTIDEAKTHLEVVVTYWFARCEDEPNL